eukprot:s1288_g11.t1
MSEGEVKPLVELRKARCWQDVEKQLHGCKLPVLKQFLSTRIRDGEIPLLKGAAVQKVLQLEKHVLPRRGRQGQGVLLFISMVVGFLLCFGAMPKPQTWECNSAWPRPICSLVRWWDAWYTLAVTERGLTALMEAVIGVHFQTQLSAVSLSALISVFGDEHDEWAAMVFTQWRESTLPDLLETALDGEVERVVDAKFAETIELFPRTEFRRRLRQSQLRRRRLLDDQAAPAVPHCPVRQGTANAGERRHTIQAVPSSFHAQVEWQHKFRSIKWFDFPRQQGIPLLSAPGEKPRLLVVHLFSGRRRVGDFHWQLQQLAERIGVEFEILSMDTAVSAYWGGLWRTSNSWVMLERCYSAGLVALTMVGSPCETFSEARFTQPPEEDPTARWPRPLRSSQWLYGLPDLSLRELHQVRAGSIFFLQGLQALCEFRTSRLKEYPEQLCAAFAAAFIEQLRTDLRAGLARHVLPFPELLDGELLRAWLARAADASRVIRQGAEWLPDFQPR